MGVLEIRVEGLKQRPDAGENLFLLDVRDESEYEISNIGGQLIPLPELSRRVNELDASRHIVTVCTINLVAQSWGRSNIQKDDEIVITWLEHHANIVPWQMLCAEKGARLRVAPVDDSGQILLDEYEKLLGPKTRIVAIAHVSNALGSSTCEGDDRGRSPSWRPCTGGWRSSRFAYARRCACPGLRHLRILRTQGLCSNRHRRGLWQARSVG
jgi:rhodanese-related sulfurtransferase